MSSNNLVVTAVESSCKQVPPLKIWLNNPQHMPARANIYSTLCSWIPFCLTLCTLMMAHSCFTNISRVLVSTLFISRASVPVW